MANLKNITELPVAESADGLNLIVNDNGAAKQIAADSVCKVKSVNGTQPDENGNVQIDTASSWNDLKDKPFYTEIGEEVILEDYAEFEAFEDMWFAEFAIDGPSFAVGDTVVVTAYGKQLKNMIGTADGNPRIKAGDEDGVALTVETWEEDGKNWLYIELHRGTTNLTISVIRETVHKIDTKYLPGYAINLDSLPFANNWYSEGTETTSMSKEQWKEMVALAKDNNKMVCGNEPGIYSMFDDGEVVMTRTDVYIAKGKINVGDYEKRLTYDEEQQLCTCTYSGENLHVTGE